MSDGMAYSGGMTQGRRNKRGGQGRVLAGRSAASFGINTAGGWRDVAGIVRPPLGIDRRTANQDGTGSWYVTHLLSGRAVGHPGRGADGRPRLRRLAPVVLPGEAPPAA